MPLIALMDCNNFFVSCELTRKPELRDKPVVVCGPNGGCAVAMSNEAKAVGVTRGVPMFKVRDIVKRHSVVLLPATHSLYGEISRKVMSTAGSIVDDMEVYSIDEAFLHIPFEGDEAVDFCRYIRAEIDSSTGIPVSIGISTTKTLAKVAARFAKKYAGYNGVCLMDTPEKIARGLQLTDIKDVWGLGRRLCRKMKVSGIDTAARFSELSEEYIARTYSVSVVRTFRELHGEQCFDRSSHSSAHHTVSHTRTFGYDIYDFGDLSARVAEYAASVAAHLRKYKRKATAIEVFLATNPYHEHAPQRSAAYTVELSEPTSDTIAIATAASKALNAVWKPGFGYKRAGVTAIKTVAGDVSQMSLFVDYNASERRNKLMNTIDSLRKAGINVQLASTQRRPESAEQQRRSDTEWK